MSVFESIRRRYLTRRTVDAPPTILLWWGSHGYAGGPTLGDLMAVENLSRRLAAAGQDHAIVSHPELGLAGHLEAENLCAIRPVERLVFVCGPLTDKGALRDVLAAQARAIKIAAGVSILPNHAAMTRRFDRIVARDGAERSFFDLAVDAVAPPSPARQLRTAGICLRGRQGEYGGKKRGMADRASQLIDALLADTGLTPVTIDTVLSPRNRADDIRAGFSSVDVVLTTRMHGALLALAAGRPVLALDQIPGGAKVAAVVGRTGWPFVHDVASLDEEGLRRAFDGLAASDAEAAIVAAQARIVALTGEALDAACRAVIA